MSITNRPVDLTSHPVAFLQFHFVEDEFPQLLSLSSLLYDIELAHDLSVIFSYERYYDTNLASPYFFFRNGRHLAPEHRARAGRVVKNSPLFLEVAVTAIGGIWVLVQILDKVSTWRLNREKLKLEIEKLKYENSLKRLELNDELLERQRSSESQRALQHVVNRLERSEFRLTDLSVRGIKDRDLDHE